MSCNYADGLSPYENKGVLGLDEKYDTTENLQLKCGILTEWINTSRHVVIHTGAGISTSAGIPDFRGPSGVWTLEKKGLKPKSNISFDEAVPTKTHMALKKLTEIGKVKFIISQNIDGLHLRSGISRLNIAELHGNIFIEQCSKCNNVADLSICLGTSLQIIPSANLPLFTKKYGGRLVICNLQPTKLDKQADLVINGNVDNIMTIVMKNLQIQIPDYDSAFDPTKKLNPLPIEMEWSIASRQIKDLKELYNIICSPGNRKNKSKSRREK
ncbi:NAD-dependent protein deacetylase Sirt6 isoform X2 [Microplitis mediator]|uniref:NAD-dependent protein deacetylase Sirt6 isoform X2 n=1 Tax=Microplitis mediator TaxID=375433 RepID=UPI00255689C1|nr:NAD-dependent protein deacetylase Sirt6 isoform X2 [Microplitis mediator]